MAQIKIYSDLPSGKVNFKGARVNSKDIGSIEASVHPTESNRIVIKSTRQFKRGSETEYRVFFRRLNINRIQNEAGDNLVDAPYNYDRGQIVDYLNTEFKRPTIAEYFEYDPGKDRLIAKKDIEVNKNGFYLGEKHKMASGNSTIYFEDLDTKGNKYPVFGEVLDQSLPANQIAGAGVEDPKSRVFGDYQSIPLGGVPVNNTSIGYDGDNFFGFNISGLGITTRAAEVVLATQQLKYEIIINGISVYVQYLEHTGFAINEDITWYFKQPLDIEAGTTLRATIYKVSTIANQEQNDGILQVCEGNATPTRYQTNVLNRFFTDEDIAFKSDVSALLSGSTYKGAYDDSTSLPALPTGTDVLGDFYRVSAPGSNYNSGDILVFNGVDYDHIAEGSVTQTDLLTSSIKVHDIYVKAGYVGAVSDGSILYPYGDITSAVNSANHNDSIYLDGEFSITGEIVLPADKSLFFYGSDDAVVKFLNYSDGNGSLFYFNGTDNTKELKFSNIKFRNAGGYGVYTKKTAKVTIADCTFNNNGWNGTALNTVLPSTTTALLGYDSTAADLQAFYAGSNASNGGAMRLEESTQVIVTGNTVTNNLRGIRVQDCGINGGGVISRNQSTQNIESGIYIAAGSLGGCHNITTTMNNTAYNANNGLLVIGGINNKFSQNEVNGNWNAGFCAWGSANTTLRDCGLYDNNRSEFNGIGNTGDAKASIQINEAYNLLGNAISLNPAFRFIAEILDTQVHYTGLGSNTEKIGFLITSEVGDLAADDKNIIKVDDVGFIGQDYAIDFSEVNLTNLRVAIGDNSFMSIGEKSVKQPITGDYFELPFSNHITNINYADFSVDSTGTVIVKEGPTGVKLNPYRVNDLQAIAFGTEIRVMLKGSNKVQFQVPVAGCSIDGVFVNSVLNQAIVQLNGLFTNTTGFASGGNPVTNFVLSGTDLTITLDDATSFTVDVTSLGVDEDHFVSSGALSGSNLELTMDDASVITIDVSNMINGSSLTATNDKWFISYGTNANQEVGTSTNDSSINQQLPLYFGQALTKGSEFKWNFQSNGGSNLIMGIWDGAEVATPYNGGSITPSNWGTMFLYAGGFTAGSNSTLTNTTNGSKYIVGTNDVLGIKFSEDGHLTLIDYSGSTPVEIAKTSIALSVSSFNLQMHTWANGTLPNGIINESGWEIVHDFDNDEDGIINGIQDHTVIKSELSILPGEKIMFMLDELGTGDFFGTDYTAASSGVGTAEEQLDNQFVYQTNEAIVMTVGGTTDWVPNTSAGGYFFAASLHQYRVGGANVIQGMFSLRYMTDNSIVLFDEDANEEVGTTTAAGDGSALKLHFGVKGNRAYYSIPTISKQTIGQGSQPDINFTPTVANQTVTVTEAEVLNFQIVSSDNIVNQYVELDAPSWMSLNQSTGVISGTAPAYVGSSADVIVVNCKAGNAIGGTIEFTVTVTVAEVVYTNTNSLKFTNGSSAYLGGPHASVTALQRTGNGSGASDAWSISMWVKPSSSTNTQTLFYYGGDDLANEGRIELTQFSGPNVLLRYGSTGNNLNFIGVGNFPVNQWNHILVTYDGGTTGNASADISSYVGRFRMMINGSNGVSQVQHQNYGWSGNIPADKFRIGRLLGATTSAYALDTVINQVAIWDSNQFTNAATIYNSGVTQNLSLLADAPDHYYEVENSVTTVTDIEGNADLTGFNFAASDLVTDTP